jgi:hypothetical protein
VPRDDGLIASPSRATRKRLLHPHDSDGSEENMLRPWEITMSSRAVRSIIPAAAQSATQ